MRRIVISDIHGRAAELDQLLRKTAANPEEVIFLGDYVDTGPNSMDVLAIVSEWCRKGAQAILGNHDDLFLRWLDNREIIYYYGSIGGMSTINSGLQSLGLKRVEYSQLLYDGKIENEIRKILIDHLHEEISFLKSLPLYIKESNFVYVHAGIHPKKGLEKTTKVEFLNLRDEFIYEYNHPETVIFGHTPVRKIHKQNDIYFGPNGVIGIDGGCAFGGQLNALIINDGKFETASV